MTRVDFYVLKSGGPDAAINYACRLTEKAWRRGHRIYIQLADAQQKQALDDHLWTFRPDAMLPHGEGEAIELGFDDNCGEHHDVLVNLSGQIPPFFSQFSRVTEVVCQQADWLQASRERWKFYKDRGYPLDKHDV